MSSKNGGRLGKLTLLECPLQSEDFRVGCVFMGGFWQEEAGTLSRITEQQWNAVQRGISWVKHKANPEVWGGALCGKTFINCVFILRQMTLSALFIWVADNTTWMPAIAFSFYTTTKLEDHVPWNIFQTCDSFTENLYPNVRASTVAVLKSQWIWSVSISLQAVH